MNKIFALVVLVLSANTFAQEIFKDGKKYGISKYGGNPEEDKNDSLIVRADYDEIRSTYVNLQYLYVGLKNGEWSFLTNNKIVNQQRYESITFEAEGDLVVAYREGYIDIYDPNENDFLIRGVQADELNNAWYLDLDNVIVTKRGKEFYGVVHYSDKKEILKAEYTKMYGNYDLQNTLIAFKEGTYYLYKTDGTLMFKLTSEHEITDIVETQTGPVGYDVIAESKKSGGMGYYHPEKKWFIEPIYSEITFLGDDPAVAVVYDGKLYGLYFQGKMVFECEWYNIEKSEEQGTLAIVTNKKGESFYAWDDGKLKQIK